MQKQDPNYHQSVGGRIKAKRIDAKMTQAELARLIDRSRSNVAQYERNDSTPPLPIAAELAKALNTPVTFFFDGTNGPAPKMPSPEEIGFVVVKEVSYGSPTTTTKVSQWGLPTAWLRGELGCNDLDQISLYRVEASLDAGWYGKFEHGDRVILDTSAPGRRPSPPGIFVYWDGFAASLAEITVKPTFNGDDMVATVNTAHGTFQTDPSHLAIIGRVKGVWKKSF
jgi:transcriptional regulator with XRE-family HTH domain